MDNDKTSDGRVVVILGMDRSGTSLCCNILHALGMRMSSHLLPGDPFNENGYFEDPEIYQTHENVLAALNRSWDTLEAIHPLPVRWWHFPAMYPFREALVDIVRRRSDEGPGIWGFKDPRTGALLPLWNEVFRICGLEPVFVLCVRHPAAVARSLAERNGFSLFFSELLWFEKTLAGCLAIQDASHCLIHYEEWFEDPLPQTRRLCKIAGLAPEGGPAALKARVSAIVNSGLRHQDSGEIHSAGARDLYALLVPSGEVPDAGLLRTFEFASEVGRDYISEVQRLTGKRHLEQAALVEDRRRWIDRCQRAERGLLERDMRWRELEEERARWMERCTGAERALAEREPLLREIEEDRARWMERCTGAEQALLERDARLREIEEDRARWMERCTGAEEALVERDARWTEQFSHATRLLGERDREIAAIRASATWRWTQKALGSWPSRRLLGRFIRAVAERRKG